VTERDDGFRRLDERSPLDGRARARRTVERLAERDEDLAPRGVGATLDAGLDALRQRFLPCFGACVLLWVGPAATVAFAEDPDFAAQFATDPTGAAFAQIAAALLSTVLTTVAQIFSAILVSVIIRSEFLGAPISLGGAIDLVRRRFFGLIGCTLLVMLLSLAGFVACFLPYFYVLWRVSVAPIACVAEQRGPVESIQRSFALTKGSFLRWAGIAIVTALLVGPLNGFAGGAAQAEVRDVALETVAMPTALYGSIVWIAATAFFALATAVTAAISTAYYYDCRVRREGLDLAARLETIAGRAPARAALEPAT
jgi:hypothetical protein